MLTIVHQTYGPGATRTACGMTSPTIIAKASRPGKKVTCKHCNEIETVRRNEAKARKAKIQ